MNKIKTGLTKMLLILCLLASVFSFSQTSPIIIIDKFQDIEVNKFEDGLIITADHLKKGFALHVNRMDNLNLSVQIKNKNGSFAKRSATVENTNNKTFILKNEFVEDGFVHIRFVKPDSSFVTIKLSIDLTKSPDTDSENKQRDENRGRMEKYDDCLSADIKSLLNKKECMLMDMIHHFGEIKESFTANKIVYVYDFGNNQSNQNFYKIYKHNDALITEPVDIYNETLRSGQTVQLKVVNVNLFRFNVTINDSVIDYGSIPNSLFNQLFIGDSNILGRVLRVFGSGAVPLATSETAEDFDNLFFAIQCLLKKYNGYNAVLLTAYNLCTSFDCCLGPTGEFYRDLIDNLTDVRLLAGKIQHDINLQKSDFNKKNEELKTCTKINADLEALQKERTKIDDIKVGDRTEFQKKRLTEIIDQVNDLESKKCKSEKIEALKADIVKLKENIDAVSAIDNLLTSLPSEQQLRLLQISIGDMVARNGVYRHLLNTSGNALEFSLQVSSKDSISKLLASPTYNHPPIVVQMPVIGRTHVSFSSGFFVALPKYLQNKTYQWQQRPDAANNVSDTAKFLLVQTGYSSPPVGFAALGNIGFKFHRDYGLGISIGVGITIESKPRPSYLLGISAQFGNERQFILTGGVAGMSIDKLQANWEAVATQKVFYSTAPPVDYYREFRIGSFLSLTYTPFTISKRR
jgi:hypothetical protein